MPDLFNTTEDFTIVPVEEVTSVLAFALAQARGGAITRDTSLWLACVGADHLIGHLERAGLLVVRRA